MQQNIFRSRLINDIKFAIQEAKNIQHINHSGLKGRFRELVASKLIKPMIPNGYAIGTGKITDQLGKFSAETDLIIYNSSILPPIMYSDNDGVFPLEATFYSIEVKSKATSTEIKDTIKKGKCLLKLSTSIFQTQDIGNDCSVVLTFFAFDSDLTGNGKSELERYAENDPDWRTNPIIRAICVVGKGYWYFTSPNEWRFHPSSNSYDEVVDLISGISNTLSHSRLTKRVASIGEYLMIERKILITHCALKPDK